MSSSPPVKKILILAANPQNTRPLRLDEEVREIEAGLERAQRREQFTITSRWAVRADDLRRALLDLEPQIVHFSGHGGGAEGLFLEDRTGQAKAASAEALANLFGLFEGKIKCVLLNACYSELQAEAIHQHVNYVMGMNQAIGDRAAIAFAVGFYDALGAGRSIEDAYQFACNAIDFEDNRQRLTPVLKIRKQTGGVVPPPPILEQPEGQVPLGSPFYEERPPVEQDCYGAIVKPGALIRVKAARQMGKTSLMTRILAHGKQQGYRAVPLYFQEADGEVFASLDPCLRWFCATITEELALPNRLDEFWRNPDLGSKRKCTNYIQQCLLSEMVSPLVLGLDEVDLVFKYPNVAQDFFALLRTWHERGKNEPGWQKLRLVIVHSKEVYIPLDMHQSPFNVGVPIELPELNCEQIVDLAQRHNLQLSREQVEQLKVLVGGHPYLVRVALYELARGRLSLAHFLPVSSTEEGPYADHLRRHWENLTAKQNLWQAFQQVIAARQPVLVGGDERFQLRSMGLVRFRGNQVEPLCELYRSYFQNRLQNG